MKKEKCTFAVNITCNVVAQVPTGARSPVRQGDRWGADVDWVLAGTYVVGGSNYISR